jgi:hypothetical protein
LLYFDKVSAIHTSVKVNPNVALTLKQIVKTSIHHHISRFAPFLKPHASQLFFISLPAHKYEALKERIKKAALIDLLYIGFSVKNLTYGPIIKGQVTLTFPRKPGPVRSRGEIWQNNPI